MSSQLRRAPHPFLPEANVFGCPDCGEIASLALVCSEPDCWSTATENTEPKSSQPLTCWIHRRGG